MTSQQQHIAEAFVSLTDTLADGVDPTVLLDRLALHCVALTGASATGILMSDARGKLRTMAVSDGRAGLLELIQLQTGQGPCVDAWRSHRQITVPRLADEAERWPAFVPLALASGYHAAYAVPIRAHRQTVGAVNLLLEEPGEELDADDVALVQALADVTAVSVVRWNVEITRPQDILTHVQAAVSAKAVVETAKGLLSAYSGGDIADAAEALYRYSARSGKRPSDIAQALIRRALTPETVYGPRVPLRSGDRPGGDTSPQGGSVQ
ncbi:GAF and ANTAR domain-containing protein [Streptomyces longisporoflavus]|uniref:GAF and ANTAR domain-containing protein n=1 Tax=Streptomyces longisporoflavus TaxID=28044 RepID=A0ABW7QQL6_9ACTN